VHRADFYVYSALSFVANQDPCEMFAMLFDAYADNERTWISIHACKKMMEDVFSAGQGDSSIVADALLQRLYDYQSAMLSAKVVRINLHESAMPHISVPDSEFPILRCCFLQFFRRYHQLLWPLIASQTSIYRKLQASACLTMDNQDALVGMNYNEIGSPKSIAPRHARFDLS
jgi:hypothetical protein